MNIRNVTGAPPSDETRFQRAVLSRVYCQFEALHIAASHHRHAAEKRARGSGWKVDACRHDDLAKFCEVHAEKLRLNPEVPTP